MDKRRYQRMQSSNLVADVSDGSGFFSGYIGDVSRRGMLLNDIPKKLDARAKRLSLVISGNGKNFKMQAIPRWVSGDGADKKMGIELVDIPYSWTQFIMGLEGDSADVWGYIH